MFGRRQTLLQAPREEAPTPTRPKVKKSALTPDDIDDFEQAAMGGTGNDLGPLSPPYSPQYEDREYERKPRERGGGSRTKKTAGRTLENELFRVDRFRLKVMKGHIRWAHKRALKAGIDPSEVDLWQLRH